CERNLGESVSLDAFLQVDLEGAVEAANAAKAGKKALFQTMAGGEEGSAGAMAREELTANDAVAAFLAERATQSGENMEEELISQAEGGGDSNSVATCSADSLVAQITDAVQIQADEPTGRERSPNGSVNSSVNTTDDSLNDLVMLQHSLLRVLAPSMLMDFLRSREYPELLSFLRSEKTSTNQMIEVEMEAVSAEVTPLAPSPPPLSSHPQIPKTSEEWAGVLLAAIHHLPHALIVCDMSLPSAPILGVNAAFELLTGYKLAECVGRNCRFLQGVDTDEVAIERIRVAIRSQQPCHVTLLNYRKDGCPIHVLLSLKPIFDAEGHCRLMVGSLSEVLENFAAMKVQLRHADRVHKLLPTTLRFPSGKEASERMGAMRLGVLREHPNAGRRRRGGGERKDFDRATECNSPPPSSAGEPNIMAEKPRLARQATCRTVATDHQEKPIDEKVLDASKMAAERARAFISAGKDLSTLVARSKPPVHVVPRSPRPRVMSARTRARTDGLRPASARGYFSSPSPSPSPSPTPGASLTPLGRRAGVGMSPSAASLMEAGALLPNLTLRNGSASAHSASPRSARSASLRVVGVGAGSSQTLAASSWLGGAMQACGLKEPLASAQAIAPLLPLFGSGAPIATSRETPGKRESPHQTSIQVEDRSTEADLKNSLLPHHGLNTTSLPSANLAEIGRSFFKDNSNLLSSVLLTLEPQMKNSASTR
ncbi:MAG: hypothetical protein SGPRY_008666, partial [Prymnesium sp.]